MHRPFDTDAHVPRPALASACGCPSRGRRLFTGGLLGAGFAAVLPATAATIPECERSIATRFVSAEQVERQAALQYGQTLRQASDARALVGGDNPQLQRLKYIASRLEPFTGDCNNRATTWRWEVNLILSRQINAFCMPGGKIAFFYGILSELQLSDDEVAMIMGHEAAHALLEHAREQTGKNTLTTGGLRLGAALLGLGNAGDLVAQGLGHFASLIYSRKDESEADALGLIMAAKAGYDPRSGVTLWQKMSAISRGAPPAWLSTHPPGPQRIKDIESRLPKVLPLYQAARRPDRHFEPPARLPPTQQRQPR